LLPNNKEANYVEEMMPVDEPEKQFSGESPDEIYEDLHVSNA